MAKPRNVLFVTPDQWRADCLSLLGHPTVRTPHLDALAADGVLFANHFVQCAPCGPSRASLLTGTYMMNHRSRRNGTPLDNRLTNLAREVREAGYDPSLIGYTDTSLDPRASGDEAPVLGQGYEGLLPGFTSLAGVPTHPDAWVDYLAAKGYEVTEKPFDMYGPLDSHWAVGGFGPYDAPARYSAEDSDTAYCTDVAMDYMADQGETPWFLHVSYLRPHPPYIAPEPYNRMYDPATVPAPRRATTPADEAAIHPFVGLDDNSVRYVGDMSDDDLAKLRAT
ncbi:MAG: sulfatase-like hydrolase/transferase [Alphaproteobacteria bacterium]